MKISERARSAPVMISQLPSAPRGATLTVADVEFGYPGGQKIFQSFSLHVRPGEFVAVLGPSGCGKTTLLNLLAGFKKPLRGQITINGAPVRPEAPELGYVFQSPQLFPWLSALENVRFGLRMANTLSVSEQLDKARHYLSLVGLEDAADKLPYQLSGGMQQRVSLARTLVLEPKLLLMDEPFAALDAITRGNMNQLILDLWSTLGQSVLFITHDIDEAIFLADRVIVLGIAPAGIHSELKINLPRPRRNLETRRLPQFFEYRNALMDGIACVLRAA